MENEEKLALLFTRYYLNGQFWNQNVHSVMRGEIDKIEQCGDRLCAIASLPSWLAFKVKETLGKLEENYVSDWKFPQF